MTHNFRENFPWARFMQLGIGQLHLSPEQFWRSSPREIVSALGSPPQPKLLRQSLDDLMKDYPDS
jgi:uncharacterized phage protein (TIGR02216 family)